jgi:hypothetical protein
MEFLGVRTYVCIDDFMITDRGCGEEMAEKISKKILKTESLSISFTDSQMSGVRALLAGLHRRRNFSALARIASLCVNGAELGLLEVSFAHVDFVT